MATTLSPEITRRDPTRFLLVGNPWRIRALVYVQRPLNVQGLCARITDAFQSITLYELETASRNILRKAQFCIGGHGSYFETVV